MKNFQNHLKLGKKSIEQFIIAVTA